MKKINIQKIILVLIPVLFIFSGISKADTFVFMDSNTYALGGSGFDNCIQCQNIFTLQTDKGLYLENINGGGEDVHVISAAYIGPSPITSSTESGYFNVKGSGNILFSSFLSSINNSNYSFTVGTDANGNNSFWPENAEYRVELFLPNYQSSGGVFLTNYNGIYDPVNTESIIDFPSVPFYLATPTSSPASIFSK